MLNLKRLSRVAGPAFIVALLVVCGQGFAAEFRADVSLIMPGDSSELKLYVKGGKYRLEHLEGKQKVICIVDRDADLTWSINPGEKKYLELKGTKGISANPLRGWERLIENMKKESKGTETLCGYECDRFHYIYPGQEDMYIDAWESRKLDHFIKQVLHTAQGDRTMELKNIKEGGVDDALFKLPEGYTRIKTREEIEALLPSITGKAKAEAPYGRRISAGASLRISVDDAMTVNVYVKNCTKTEAVVTVTPFLNGKQVESIGVSPYKLSYKGSSHSWDFNKDLISDAFRVDEVVIKVDNSMVYANVEQNGENKAGEKIMNLYNGGDLTTWKQVSPDRDLVIEITGDNLIGPDTRGMMFVKGDDREKYEKVEFVIKNKETKTWNYPSSKKYNDVQITILLGDGGARIRIVQP